MALENAPGRMPVLFIGHGSPTTILTDNDATRGWARIGASLPRPKSILVISAHWYTRGTAVTAMAAPRTIHDFGPLAPELFEMAYPAPGDPQLAARVQTLLEPTRVTLDDSWGFDHGCWTVLKKAFPEADIPVVQLSLDHALSGQEHYALSQKLRPLRDEHVLIIASGNIVHNMSTLIWRDDAPTYPWGEKFRDHLVGHIRDRNFDPVIDYQQGGQDALHSVPAPDHYFPLMYALGASSDDDTISVENDFFQLGSIGMTSFVFSAA
ncbi:MAG: 4,5-DOPA dioxygenase extradiol [Pseudomonadota bacterium]